MNNHPVNLEAKREAAQREAALQRDMRRGEFITRAGNAVDKMVKGMPFDEAAPLLADCICECARAMANPDYTLRQEHENAVYAKCVQPHVIVAMGSVPDKDQAQESRAIHFSIIRNLMQHPLAEMLRAMEPVVKAPEMAA